MGKEKAYVFSMEALLSVIVFILFFVVTMNFFLGTTETVFSRISMKRIAIDALDALDELDSLESLDSGIITEKIEKAMPERIFWKLSIIQYSLSKDVFSQTKTIELGSTAESTSGKDVVKAKRLFLTFSSGQISRYNTAELWVWLK